MLRTKMVDLERNRLVSITAITNILLVNQKKKNRNSFRFERKYGNIN